MILRINNRDAEITRGMLRRNGVAIEGPFETLMESITCPGQILEREDGTVVAVTDASFNVTKNACLVSLHPSLGEETYVVFPGHYGELEYPVRELASDDLDYVMRVCVMPVGNINS